MTDEEIILKHDPRVRPRAKMELKIVNALLEAAEKAGYKLIEREENEEATKDLLFNLDEAYRVYHRAPKYLSEFPYHRNQGK
jgi:hypothetical protein